MPEEPNHQSDPQQQQHNSGHLIQPSDYSADHQPAHSAQPNPLPSLSVPDPQSVASQNSVPPSLPVPPLSTQEEHHQSHQDKKNKQTGVTSLIAGLVLVVFALAIPNISFISRASSNLPFYIIYSSLAICCLVSLVAITGSSFKKIEYPNVLGLIGLIFNCIVLYSALSYLVIYAFTGNN